ncbi:MAG: ATP-binding cassette domain-containing protein [Myxococcales bacterium]|nr:ATP-binding cassette domain-containing protein [Myxococcales bacterium]
MIALEHVSRRYGRAGEIVALDDVSLEIDEGEFVLLSGPSGAGKSTLLKLIFAAERPESGTIRVLGHDLARLRGSSVPFLRRNIGVVFQNFRLLPGLSALDNVAIALEVRGLPRRVIRERAASALGLVGLARRLEARAGWLSAGEQQRVAIARAIAGEPAILLADEPTGNLDPRLTLDLLQILFEVNRRGTTIIVATHDLQVMAAGARHGWRHLGLETGRIVAPTRHQWLDDAEMVAAAVAPHDLGSVPPIAHDPSHSADHAIFADQPSLHDLMPEQLALAPSGYDESAAEIVPLHVVRSANGRPS